MVTVGIGLSERATVTKSGSDVAPRKLEMVTRKANVWPRRSSAGVNVTASVEAVNAVSRCWIM